MNINPSSSIKTVAFAQNKGKLTDLGRMEWPLQGGSNIIYINLNVYHERLLPATRILFTK